MMRANITAGSIILSLALVACFLLPALLNRAPILYPDTLGYYQSGKAAVVAAERLLTGPQKQEDANRAGLQHNVLEAATPDNGISTARSVYYGIVFFLARNAMGDWGMPLFQAILTVAALWLSARHILGRNPVAIAAIMALTGLVAGASAFTSAIMPDIFTGLLILAIATSAVFWKAMPLPERAFWLGLTALTILFHKADALIGGALIAISLIASFWIRHLDKRALAFMVLSLSTGIAGHVAVDMTLLGMGQAPVSPPFLLARVIGDGTGEAYLRETCRDRHFYTCRFLHQMPMTENEFLWVHDGDRGAFGTLDRKERLQVLNEQKAIVIGTLQMHGMRQFEVSGMAFLKQFFEVGVSEYGLAPVANSTDPGFNLTIERYSRSAIAEGTMPLGPISATMLICYIFGWGLFLWSLVARPRKGDDNLNDPLMTLWLVTGAGVIVNAAVCGMIAGVFDRYQGRVAWLMLFCGLILLTRQWRQKNPRNGEGQNP